MMKPHSIYFLGIISASTLFFTGCGSSVGGSGDLYDPGYGPFDKKGNYLEAEADKPAKQKRRPSYSGGSKAVAKTKKIEVKEEEKVETLTSTTTSTPVVKTTTVATPKPKPYVAPKPKPKPKVVSTPKPAPKPKPKPKVVSKPKPKPKVLSKPKPKTVFHKVVKGDTLYSLSRKYGTTVSSIQKANGLKSTIIPLGASLKIPK